MRHTQTCRGACQERALPQTSTVSGHVSSQMGAAGEENQESEALMFLLTRHGEDFNGCSAADSFDQRGNSN